MNFVVMAKYPAAGAVKTRLVSADEGITAAMAADIAACMLRCVLERLHCCGRVTLAISPDEAIGCVESDLSLVHVPVIGQGEGNLGERLDRVWSKISHDQPVAFFGIDSPDVPAEAIGRIEEVLRRSDAAIGPTTDGGYWTLAARRYAPPLLAGIDWGSEWVYDQTVSRAEQAGLSIGRLVEWPDVDTPDDVHRLHARLAGDRARLESAGDIDQPLVTLADSLDRILGNRKH